MLPDHGLGRRQYWPAHQDRGDSLNRELRIEQDLCASVKYESRLRADDSDQGPLCGNPFEIRKPSLLSRRLMLT
jgi:hypothetical protein